MRRYSTLIVAAAVATALILPVAASAATPQAGGSLDLQTWVDQGQLIVVTAISIDPSVKLPTTVRIPIATGAEVNWAGEVLGGPVSADPSRPYKIKTGAAGGKYAEFTVETTRAAQVDTTVNGVGTNGATTMAKLEWVQSVDSPFTTFSVRVPAGATNVTITPTPTAQPETGQDGEKLYYGDPMTLDPGAKQQVSFTYSTGGASGTPVTGGGGSSTPIVFGLVAAILVMIGVVIVLIRRQRNASE